MTALLDRTEFSDINKVFLLLGPACNMSCRHCSQTPVKMCDIKQKKLSSDCIKFLDNYVTYAISVKKKHSIIFWGGEPLLHWNFIHDTVIRFYQKFNFAEHHYFPFSLVTNGLLLTDEMISFFNEYHVGISFSYDVPYPFAVRGKVSDEVCEKVKNLKYLTTMSTFNALNYDYILALDCIRKKFPDAKHNFNFALLHTFAMPEDVYRYDFDKVKTALRKLRIYAMQGDIDAAKMIYNLVWPLSKPSSENAKFYKRHQQWFNDFGIKPCFPCSSGLSVDLEGRIMSCHNSLRNIATIEDDLDTIQDSLVTVYKKNKSSECVTCEHNDICMGICSSSVKDEDGNYMACKEFRKEFFTCVKKEFSLMKKPLSKEELEWFNEERKKDYEFLKNF